MEIDPKETIRINEEAGGSTWNMSKSGICGVQMYKVSPQCTDSGSMSKSAALAIIHNHTAAPEYAKRIEKALEQIKCDRSPEGMDKLVAILKGNDD